MPKYKYVREMIISEEELIKTTTLKIKRHEEVFEPDGFEYRACHRGALTVRREVNNGKLKQHSNRIVAWG